jgi:isoleucyl-tRNA synthetase
MLGSLHGFVPERDAVAADRLLSVDAWALTQAARNQDEIRADYDNADFHLVYQKLHNYCVVDLGGLYLDILKDRLYTLPEAHPARRSAQTVLWHLAEAMVRWIAPILSFTADEVWRLLPGDRQRSVFAQSWYPLPDASDRADMIDWPYFLSAREAVKKELEALRVRGEIGSSLDAEVDLYAEEPMFKALEKVGDELRFWFITSGARVHRLDEYPQNSMAAKDETAVPPRVFARESKHAKCQLCWHHRPDIGADPTHPALCGRCVENVAGAGETRRYI